MVCTYNTYIYLFNNIYAILRQDIDVYIHVTYTYTCNLPNLKLLFLNTNIGKLHTMYNTILYKYLRPLFDTIYL